MKKLILCVIGIIFIGCSSTKYKQIENLKHSAKDSKCSIVTSNKNFFPLKEVFKKLDTEISSNFLAIFSWVNHLPRAGTNDFQCLIYDYDKELIYYTYNKEQDIYDIKISITDTSKFYTEKLILKNYLSLDTANSSKLYKQKFQSAEIGTDYNLLDLKKHKILCFKNIVLDQNEK